MMVILTTVPDEEQALRLANDLVRERLAACVQILPRMRSIYVWEAEIQTEEEHLLLIKTLAEKYDDVEKFILANHSYETPEIVAIDTTRVSEGYLGWLKDYL